MRRRTLLKGNFFLTKRELFFLKREIISILSDPAQMAMFPINNKIRSPIEIAFWPDVGVMLKPKF